MVDLAQLLIGWISIRVSPDVQKLKSVFPFYFASIKYSINCRDMSFQVVVWNIFDAGKSRSIWRQKIGPNYFRHQKSTDIYWLHWIERLNRYVVAKEHIFNLKVSWDDWKLSKWIKYNSIQLICCLRPVNYRTFEMTRPEIVETPNATNNQHYKPYTFSHSPGVTTQQEIKPWNYTMKVSHYFNNKIAHLGDLQYRNIQPNRIFAHSNPCYFYLSHFHSEMDFQHLFLFHIRHCIMVGGSMFQHLLLNESKRWICNPYISNWGSIF